MTDKRDSLEAAFEALEREDEDLADLKREMEQLRQRLDARAAKKGPNHVQ